MTNAGDIITRKGTQIISVSADTTVRETLKKMAENKVGAMLIVDDNNAISGIWTERDLMRNTIEDGFNADTAVIGDLMSTNLQSSPHTATVFELMDKFLGLRLRHLLIKEEGRYIGLLSIGDVIKANLQEKTAELHDLNAIVSWEYYEDWKHIPKP